MAKIEVFTEGCPLCAEKARAYGIDRLPTVVVNGQIVGCCSQGKPDAESIRSARLESH